MLALRKKKMHQQLFTECEQNLMNLEELIGNIEIARMQKEAVQALALGTTTLKRINAEMGGADYVQKLMDERDDAVAELEEINEALSAGGIAADDADALAEFAKLE